MYTETDEDIAIKVQDGDPEAFGVLIERYEAKIIRYGRKFLYQYEDIEDAVQDIFIKAYTNINSFNTSKKFSSWIYRIAHNTFINVIKKKGREPVTFFDPDAIFSYRSNEPSQEDKISIKDDIKLLEEVITILDPKHREPLILYFFEEKDYKEIADILRIPISTVGVRIKRGKAKVKQLIENHE